MAGASGRVAEWRKVLGALREGAGDAVPALTHRFHRLSAAGGASGFQEISDISRETERWLKQRTSPDIAGADAERLEHAVGKLAEAFDNAADEL